LNNSINDALPCRISFDELYRKPLEDERTAGQIKYDIERAVSRVVKLGDHQTLISESVAESDYLLVDRAQDAFLKMDKAELGELFYQMIFDHAKSEAGL